MYVFDIWFTMVVFEKFLYWTLFAYRLHFYNMKKLSQATIDKLQSEFTDTVKIYGTYTLNCNEPDLLTVLWRDQKNLCNFLNKILQFKQNNLYFKTCWEGEYYGLLVRTNWSITLWSRNMSKCLDSNIIVISHLSVCRLPLPAQTDQLPFDFERRGLSHFRCDCLLLHLSDDVIDLEFYLHR